MLGMGVLGASRTELFLAIARRVVPEVAHLDEDGRASFLAPVEKMLGSKSPAVRRKLFVFLSVMRWTPVLRYGRRFDALGAGPQDAVLRWFFRSPVGALRKGFWGVKTLVFLGYYGRPEVGASIGYVPARDGNARLHA